MQVVYADEVFFINFAADYLLLLAAARIAGVTVKRWRLAVAGAAGAAYSVAAAISTMPVITSAVFKVVCAAAMTLIAFGDKRGIGKLFLIFLAVSAAFAGAVMGASLLGGGKAALFSQPVGFDVLFVSFAVCWAVFSLVFRHMAKHRVEGTLCRMTVKEGGRAVTFSALVDTGNTLTDPMTGEPVTVCAAGEITPLFDGAVADVLKNVGQTGETEAFRMLRESGNTTRFFLVPYTSVGKDGGIMLAFRPAEMSRDGEKTPGLVGIVPDGVISGAGYAAVTGQN